MNKEKLYEAIGEADEELLERSEKYLKRAKISWVKWGTAAACILLLASAAIAIYVNYLDRTKTETSCGVPAIIIDGVTYYKSGWKTDVEQCPDGFGSGGIVDSVNQDGAYLLNSKYYINSKIPEWIYVYCQVWESSDGTNGEISFMAYVRFVPAVERWKNFILYNGQLYQSLWDYCAVANDEKTAYNNSRDIESRYGLRIEMLPEGCVLAGNAHLEELDRIPQTELGVNNSNYNEADVYANPNDKQVLYVSFSWYTATDEENGETLHNGYDVFVLYNPDNYQS